MDFSASVMASRAAYCTQIPPEGQHAIHSPCPVLKRNIVRERELLVQQQPVSVKKDGAAYIYTMPNGELYTSYYPPETMQWQPGP